MLRNLGYLEEERNEQIRKENERRFQQEQQRINNQRLHEINERNRIALERENARRRAEEKRKAEQKRKETSRTNTNVPPSQPKNNRWSIGSNPTLLPRAPPALVTAEARVLSAIQAIPPWKIGYLHPNSSVIFVFI